MSASGSSPTSPSTSTLLRMYSASQGAEENCTRCVTSCRQTQRRKSLGDTPSARSTATMFGATSNKVPSGPVNGSYWPRIAVDRNASIAPACTPAGLPASSLPPAGAPPVPVSWAMESAAATIQPGRSTILAVGTGRSSSNPLTSRTGASARSDASASSATTCSAE